MYTDLRQRLFSIRHDTYSAAAMVQVYGVGVGDLDIKGKNMW